MSAEKPSEVVVVNYNDDDDDDMVTSYGYDVTELPAELFTDPAGRQKPNQIPPFAGLEKFVPRKLINQWMNEWRRKMGNGESQSQIREWVERLFDQYGPKVIGSKPCTRRHQLYRSDVRAAPRVGLVVTSPCHVCNK